MAAAEFAATAMSNGDAAAGVPMQEQRRSAGPAHPTPESTFVVGFRRRERLLQARGKTREPAAIVASPGGGRDGTEPS